MPCLQCNRLQSFAAEAFPTDTEDSGVIKDTVQRTQKRIVLVEILPPKRRTLVARKDKVVCPFLVVAAVHHVEEQARALLVELAMPDLVDDQAGGANEGGQCACLLAQPSCVYEFVPKFGRLDEICLQAVLTALVSEHHCQMRLPCPRRTDERDVFVGVNSHQVQRQAAGFHEHLNRGLLFHGADICEDIIHCSDGFHGIFLFLCNPCELGRRESSFRTLLHLSMASQNASLIPSHPFVEVEFLKGVRRFWWLRHLDMRPHRSCWMLFRLTGHNILVFAETVMPAPCYLVRGKQLRQILRIDINMASWRMTLATRPV